MDTFVMAKDWIDNREAGGWVHPIQIDSSSTTMVYGGGLTQRDNIAIHAMAAIISKGPFLDGEDANRTNEIFELTARGAYAYADAMLKERDK